MMSETLKMMASQEQVSNSVSHEFSVSQTSSVKSKLPAPATTSALSRNAMSNWKFKKDSPRDRIAHQTNQFSTNLQIFWALMDSVFQEKMMGILTNGVAVAFV